MLGRLEVDSLVVEVRRATPEDLHDVVALLAADQLGVVKDGLADGEDPGPYRLALDAIDRDPAQLLVVATVEGSVVATMQLSFIPGLSSRGAMRSQAENVRVRDDLRSRGVGAALFGWAVDESRRRGCTLMQLTTNNSRHDAHRFYERLGFTASHKGFKRTI